MEYYEQFHSANHLSESWNFGQIEAAKPEIVAEKAVLESLVYSPLNAMDAFRTLFDKTTRVAPNMGAEGWLYLEEICSNLSLSTSRISNPEYDFHLEWAADVISTASQQDHCAPARKFFTSCAERIVGHETGNKLVCDVKEVPSLRGWNLVNTITSGLGVATGLVGAIYSYLNRSSYYLIESAVVAATAAAVYPIGNKLVRWQQNRIFLNNVDNLMKGAMPFVVDEWVRAVRENARVVVSVEDKYRDLYDLAACDIILLQGNREAQRELKKRKNLRRSIGGDGWKIDIIDDIQRYRGSEVCEFIERKRFPKKYGFEPERYRGFVIRVMPERGHPILDGTCLRFMALPPESTTSSKLVFG